MISLLRMRLLSISTNRDGIDHCLDDLLPEGGEEAMRRILLDDRGTAKTLLQPSRQGT